ncbi:MAG: hypothetical protein ACD_28C00325G0006 [uncultured bacterium]|nr:MAG: hypothetical protein ACD_28C00325G0006 [uncultured bacterium]KKT74948.1 MAG: Cell division FtsK/SpoIIIE [Candidatus Peregrinibacteria bacterium GW2011_GWA2_44_7]
MAKRRSRLKSRSGSRRKGIQIRVASHVMREIWAVVYMAFCVLTLLSINEKLGVVGSLWNDFLTPIFGWGIYMVPLLLGGVSLALFFARRISFDAGRILGLVLLVISSLGTLHLSVADDQIYAVAQDGEYGGYIGFVSSFIGRQILGITGSYVVFFALFVISILLTFSISLREIFSLFEWKWEVKDRSAARSRMDAPSSYPSNADEAIELEDEDMVIHLLNGKKDSGAMEDEDALLVREVEDDEGLEGRVKGWQDFSDDGEEEDLEESLGEPVAVERIGKDDSFSSEASTNLVSIPWEFPPLDLLNDESISIQMNQELLREKADAIRDKLAQFGIQVKMHDVHVGPTVIQYTLKPSEGVKLSRITSLKNDLALAMAASAIRIEAPIAGKSFVGIEIPNETRSIVHLRELLQCEDYLNFQKKTKSKLLIPLGRDVTGKAIVTDLALMPHMLVAGATGSGKSVATNAILLSFLYQNSPKDLKLILIDPKQVELSSYNGIPHLLTPVITQPDKAAIALRWVVAEMTRRYTVCAESGHRNIDDYNDDPQSPQPMPKIVVVIDELADLMMVAGKEVEASICRIAQMARAVGIHLIVATQRPSVDVITGLIKANIPCRVAFTVSSSIDSRTILDGMGAEDLLGRGDMLYLSGTMSKPLRIQGVYVSTQEIQKVTNRVKLTLEGYETTYNDDITSRKTAGIKLSGVPDASVGAGMDDDELYEQAVEVVTRTQKASATLLQRHLKVGYSRAARLIDMLEENGVIGPGDGAKAREVFVGRE